MTSRRDFFRGGVKGAGLAGAFFAGLMAPVVVERVKEVQVLPPKVEPEDISHLAPESPTTLVLQGGVKKQEPPPSGNGFYIAPMNVEYTNKVAMSVGKDNRLWIQVDGQWRRVAIDPWCDPTYCDPAQT
jgi:hypothetical protein